MSTTKNQHRVVPAHETRFDPACVFLSAHTLLHPETSLPALFLQTITKMLPSQRVSALPVETLTL